MKKLFKSFWKIVLFLVLIGAVVVLAIIFWPKTTGEKISSQVSDVVTEEYVSSSLEKQKEVVSYIQNSSFMNNKKISDEDASVLENAKNKLALSTQIIDNINYLNRYALFLDKKQDKDTLKNLKKEIKDINKSLKNLNNSFVINYNLVTSYSGTEDTSSATAKIKVEKFIEVIDKQLVEFNRLQNALYNSLINKVSTNTLEKTVLINNIEYSSVLVGKINTENVKYSSYSVSLNDYVTLFTKVFNDEFDYNNYYISTTLQDFVTNSKKANLHDFYVHYQTEEYEKYINVMADEEKQKVINLYNSITLLLPVTENEGGNE